MLFRSALAMLLLLTACPAFAEEWKADPPGVWRKMTWEDETTTSKCIGKLISPICAVETKEAGLVRERNDLFAMAVDGSEGRTFIRSHTGYTNVWMSYRLSRIKKVIRREPIDLLGIDATPGDYLIDVRDRQCYHNSGYCGEDIGPPTTHLVRKIGDEWRIITWNTPRW